MRGVLKARLLALLLLGGGLAQAASIGTFGGPHIVGRVAPGEAAEVRQDFAAGFAKPLRLRIAMDSDELEVLRIGQWLRAQRPVLDLRSDCIGPCARYLLSAGRTLILAPNTLIALSAMSDWPDRLRRDLEAGTLFAGGSGNSSRERFEQRFQPQFARSAAVLQARTEAAPELPPAALDFLERLTASQGIDQLVFDETRFDLRMRTSKHRCFWWVPNAEGMRQLGLDVPDYQPPSRAEAAKRLKTSPELIYIGSIPAELPEEPLCALPTGDDKSPAPPV